VKSSAYETCTSFDVAAAAAMTSAGVTGSASDILEAGLVDVARRGQPAALRCEYAGERAGSSVGLEVVIEPPGGEPGDRCPPGLSCRHIAVGLGGLSEGGGSYSVATGGGWSFFLSTVALSESEALPLLRAINGVMLG
jgi:hypothetical protein